MQAGTFVIFLGTATKTNPLCLGRAQRADGTYYCAVLPFDPESSETSWVVAPVPGAEKLDGFYLQHLASGLSPHFADPDAISLDTLDPTSSEFFLRADAVGNGFVAINRYDDNRVMDASGDLPRAGAKVISREWNKGNNQRWRFISTIMFTGMMP